MASCLEDIKLGIYFENVVVSISHSCWIHLDTVDTLKHTEARIT